MSMDGSEVFALAADLGTKPAAAMREVRPVLERGALNMKRGMAKDFADSWHFAGIAGTISYEVTAAGDTITAEVGPDKARGGIASLAGIAYFGGANGGGGTIPDPVHVIDAEVPRVIDYLGKIGGDIL